MLKSKDIIFLYETWADKSSDIDLSGYTSINIYRKFRHRNAKRQSGGIAVYYKECLSEGITIVRNHYDTIVWLKLDKNFFMFENDIYLCGNYIWCEDSPAYNVYNVDLFQLLHADIYDFEDLGSIFIFRDFNSRVGIRPDYVVCDMHNLFTDDDEYVPDTPLGRASLDKNVNSHGHKFLDLCKATGLRIANGRLGTDSEGSHTFCKMHGSSVIDYLLLKECEFSRIHNFSVENFNEWSDHAPLTFVLQCITQDDPGVCYNYLSCKWDSSHRETFRNQLIGRLGEFNRLVDNIDTSDRNAVNNAVNGFSKLIRACGDPLFCKDVTVKDKTVFSDCVFKSNNWFDAECRNAKYLYKEALRTFNNSRTDENRIILHERKKAFKTLTRRKRRLFLNKKTQEIMNLRHTKPKEFWKYFKKKNSSKRCNINNEEFKNYFMNMANDLFQVRNEEAENFCASHDFNNLDCSFAELDAPISIDEIKLAISKLKNSKACSGDLLLNEYFIESHDILSAHVCDLFNAIFESGYFPESWSLGYIVPLHKKGNIGDVNNYRGITLVSCMAKLFTSILNKRISLFCESNNVISDSQFGFRKGMSTVDALFVLMSVVQKYLNDNKRLYGAFVDMKKAFDSVNRNALWLKLYKTGIQGKMLRIIKNMYSKIKSCVKSCNSYSDFFEYAIGLRQGETISPILYALFVEDLELFLQDKVESGLSLDDIILILILFADDMIILGNSPTELQNSLNLLYNYTIKWGLEVNVDKTKAMVFRKRGGLKRDEHWTYNGKALEVVNDFNYLGTVFNYTGNFNLNQEHLIGKAVKAMHVLNTNCRRFDLTPKILCQLFDAFVTSTLNYACEIWGYTKSKEIERVHLRFCKTLLNVKLSTSNVGIYGELCRYPLYISRYVRIIKYWCKIVNTNNILLSTVYKIALDDHLKGRTNWVSNIKTLLCENGFGYIWEFPNRFVLNNFHTEIKQRLIDTFVQTWNTSVNANKVLDLYSGYKLNFEYERYLDVLPSDLRIYFSRLRLASHSLRIQTGRYMGQRLERNLRFCLICNTQDIEDEYHFTLICNNYNDIRKKYIKRYYYVRPSVFKFTQLMQSENRKELYNLARYIKEAFTFRNSILNVMQIE